MKRFRNCLPAILIWLACIFLCSGTTWAYTIDGHMDDWKIPLWTGFETSDSVAHPFTGTSTGGVYYWEEDGVGTGGLVGPGYGGQNYDIEAFYAAFDSNNLYLGVITGYYPSVDGKWLGDIGISDANDGVYEYGIDTTTGALFSNLTSSDWSTSFYPQHASSGPVSISSGLSGDPVNSSSFFYGLGQINGSTGSLYVIEVAIPLLNLTGINWGNGAYFHLTQWCGNDVANLTFHHTPEPATMVLLGTGLLGMAGVARRMRKRINLRNSSKWAREN